MKLRIAAPAGAVLALLLAAAPAAAASGVAHDGLALASVVAAAGATAKVPVYLRDLGYTPLGRDQLVGSKIQAIALQVQWSPSSAVVAASFARAGVAAGLPVLTETTGTWADTASWLVSFAEEGAELPLRLDAPAPGDLVGELQLTLAAGVPPGTVVALRAVREATMLTDQGGTRRETPADGTLLVGDGSVTVPYLVRITTPDAAASEPGTNTGKALVRLDGPALEPVTVRYTLAGTATNGVDYRRLGGSVVVPRGKKSAAIVVVPIDDSAREGTETVVIKLRRGTVTRPGAPAAATIAVGDDD